ncbi:MAG: hypothetical protein QW728_01430 [Thermoplasmata archaeon]
MGKIRIENAFDPSQTKEIEVKEADYNMTCGDFVAMQGLVPLNVGDQFDVFDVLANRITEHTIGKYVDGKPITVGPKSVPGGIGEIGKGC